MGATWVKTNKHIPILIPPFDYSDIKGVIPTTHGMKINEKEKFNSLKEAIEHLFELDSIGVNVWERKRDKILKEIKGILDENVSVSSNSKIEKALESFFNSDDEPEKISEKIKKQSKVEWPEDFEMQLDYIQRQNSAINKLNNHKPMDIDVEDFKLIRKKAKEEWPDDYEMQLDYEQKQVESLRRLNKL